MRLAQIVAPDGQIHAAVVEGDRLFDISGDNHGDHPLTVRDLIARSVDSGRSVAELAQEARGQSAGKSYTYSALLSGDASQGVRLTMPVTPGESWGCGVTYKRSAEFRDEDAQNTTKGMYDYVYSAKRPEVFYKGTGQRVVGPNEPIGIRSDSTFTAPEPELALVLDRQGGIVGFTCANDVSAWDIERENPLYLPQSKVFIGCLAIGPVIVTLDEIPVDRVLKEGIRLSCRIERGGKTIFSGEVMTSQIGRTFDELIAYLMLDNPTPDGTVVCTGTGIIVESDQALAEGDSVEIEVDGIGLLKNPVRRLKGRA